METAMIQLQYPIGKFNAPSEVNSEHLASWIADIETFPAKLRALVTPLTTAQLDTRYRSDGWTVQQVVHHLADSHLNSFIRFKWALTEERPCIKAYYEDRWAKLPDYSGTSIGVSLDLIAALHHRWCVLLRGLEPVDLNGEFIHPESGPVSLSVNIGIYAWHGRHHMAHIKNLGIREGWH